jgi:hypothetical protein
MNARFRAGFEAVWFSAPMMKPIRTLGAAVVALAAPALFALPAAADGPRGTIAKVETPLLGAEITLSSGARYDHREDFRGPRYNGRNEWGQTDRQVAELRRDALQACRAVSLSPSRRWSLNLAAATLKPVSIARCAMAVSRRFPASPTTGITAGDRLQAAAGNPT